MALSLLDDVQERITKSNKCIAIEVHILGKGGV